MPWISVYPLWILRKKGHGRGHFPHFVRACRGEIILSKKLRTSPLLSINVCIEIVSLCGQDLVIPVFYDAWVKGQTGYPLIDACMRNLVYNGWITFRMRAMLVSLQVIICG